MSTAPSSTRERRVHGDAERDRFAVHRPAGGDDEVGESDEALRVDRLRRDEDGGQRSRDDLCSLLRRSREDDRVRVRVAPESLEDVREQRVRLAVVQRHVRRCPHDDDRAVAIDAELVEDARVGREPVEVVLLLETGVAPHFRRPCAEPVEPVLWDRLGDDDAARGAAPEAVLDAGELVVERVARRDAERARHHRQLVRGVRERDVEASPASRSAEARGGGRTSPVPSRQLAAPPWGGPTTSCSMPWSVSSSSVWAYSRVVTRTLVAALAKQRDERSEERHLR